MILLTLEQYCCWCTTLKMKPFLILATFLSSCVTEIKPSKLQLPMDFYYYKPIDTSNKVVAGQLRAALLESPTFQSLVRSSGAKFRI